MNDKQQLAAMGAELHLTEEQAKALSERMPKTGTLQILNDEPLCTEIRINGVEACGADIGGLLDRCLPHTTEQKPLCMAKRIEELEGQVRVMGGALNELREFAAANVWDDYERGALLAIIDAALVGKLPTPVVPEGWQLVPVKPTQEMADAAKWIDGRLSVWKWADGYKAMLAAAPSPDGTK